MMKIHILANPLLRLVLSGKLAFALSGAASAVVVFSDDFSGPNGTSIIGTSADVGGQWESFQGPDPVFSSGNALLTSTDVTGGDPFVDAGASFTSELGAANPIMLVTVDLSAVSYTYPPGDGFDAVSIYFDGGSLVPDFRIAKSNGSLQWYLDGTPVPGLVGPGVATLAYNYNTGLTQVFAGTTASGPVLASVNGVVGQEVDGIGLSAIGGGVMAVNSLTVQFIPEPSVTLLAGLGLAGVLIRRRR